jgi:hypothetical protein
MMTRLLAPSRKLSIVCGLLLFLDAPRLLLGEPTTAAVSAFNAYSKSVESRLAQQHRSRNAFLAPVASDAMSRSLSGSRLPRASIFPEHSCTTGAARRLLPEPKPRTSIG